MSGMSAIEALRPFANETFVIVGKGPSFDAEKVANADATTICINDTINHIAEPDFCCFNDMHTIGKLGLEAIERTRAFLVPSTLNPDSRLDQMPLSWMLFAERLSAIRGKASFFEKNGRPHRVLWGEPIIHAWNSTYESVIWLLAHAGAKRVRTSGIDCTTAYHPIFGEREGDVPFKAMRYYAQVAIDAFGMDVCPL